MDKVGIILGICLLLGLFGCNSDLDTWSGKDVVYLDQTVDSTVVSFAYIDTKYEYDTVSLRVNVMGEVMDVARQVSVKVTGNNAEAGTDYVPLLDVYEVEPGATYCMIPVYLKRTEALQHEIKEIKIELVANDDFDLLYQEDVPSIGSTVVYNKLSQRILFHEMILEAPDTWNEYWFGKFSAKKFTTICDVMDISRESFLDYTYMTFGRIQIIARYMDDYLDGLSEPLLDEDGKEMTMGEGVIS